MAKAKARGKKRPSTRAGEFVRREIETIRAGEHGAQNAKQAIAIGLSKARRAGVPVGENPRRRTKKKNSRRAPAKSRVSKTRRAKAAVRALKKKPRAAVSHRALSRQARAVARRKK